jgi:hypothetical protein
MENNKNNKPEKHIKFGGVRVTIWRENRKNQSGQSFESRSVTLDRAYKDAQGEWQNTGSLREADIPKAIAALSKAYTCVMEKENDAE